MATGKTVCHYCTATVAAQFRNGNPRYEKNFCDIRCKNTWLANQPRKSRDGHQRRYSDSEKYQHWLKHYSILNDIVRTGLVDDEVAWVDGHRIGCVCVQCASWRTLADKLDKASETW